jgi:PucR family transcriptional regulator, purine catabolism regulatory protein
MKNCSIRDLLRLALPFGSRLLTGKAGLSRQAEHAVSLRATLPAFPTLRGGELVLLSVQDALALDDNLTLPRIIKRLGDVPVAGLGVIGPIDEESVSIAIDADLPLLQLPASAVARVVERDVLLLLDKPDLQLDRRAAQLYSQLTAEVATGAGVEGILCTVHEATDRAVAFYDATGELRMQYGTRPAPAVFAAIRPRGETRIPPAESDGQTIIIKPVDKGTTLLGFVALGGRPLQHWDDLALDRAAAALALELSKQQAVQAVEARAGGDLLRAIVSGMPLDMGLLHEQALELGYDLSRPHVALLIASANPSIPIDRVRDHLQQELQARQVGAPFIASENSLLCLYPETDDTGHAIDLLRALQNDLPISAGLSSSTRDATEWQRAYDQAQQAILLGRQIFGPQSLTRFDDLHVYRLLYELRASPELIRFHEEVLGALVEYDRRHHSTLLLTLEGYFNTQGNLREAAERLQIHRNTLLYRLRRIEQIAGIDMARTEDMLALQIGLKAHRLLGLPAISHPDPAQNTVLELMERGAPVPQRLTNLE